MHAFYSQPGVPSHSVLLFPTREQATSYPRGSLRLALCRACGFIANVDMDVSLQNYSTACEETQAHSPHFRRFLDDLARGLVERHGLRGREILEIGSGKAEFLALLCALGDNRGVGIDPAGVPERLDPGAAERVRLVQDYYSERHADLAADVVVCRHTLEHIPDTGDFLRLVRRSIGDRLDTLVFFELPDVGRVLREGAFWDLYYEHCSYFTPGSLARLFRLTGFEVERLELAYDAQYILLEARPAPEDPAGPALALEEGPEEVTRAVEGFRAGVDAALSRWEAWFGELRAQGRRPVVWGSGSKGVAFLTTLDGGRQVEYVVDINPHKHGKFMPGTGQEIVAPEFLTGYRPDVVIAMNPVYRAEIEAELRSLGVDAEVTAL
jgi:SAM-dependent methyltransferase